MVMKSFYPEKATPVPASAKLLMEFPKDDVLYETVWAKIGGMPFCCSGGTIGHIGGKKIFEQSRKFYTSDLPTINTPFKSAVTMRDLCFNVVPSNRLFAAPVDWMYWAILENLLKKQESGHIDLLMKSNETAEAWLDTEKNTVQPFWAGPSYKVKMWFMSDKPNESIEKAKTLGVQNFVAWIKDQKLGTITESGDIPGSYSGFVHGYVLSPNFGLIKERLTEVLPDANKELQRRWDLVSPHVKGIKPIIDKVARGW